MAQFGIEESLLQACRDLEKILIQWNAGAGIRNPSSLIDHLLSQEVRPSSLFNQKQNVSGYFGKYSFPHGREMGIQRSIQYFSTSLF